MKFFYNIMKTWTGRDLSPDPANPVHAADVFVANGPGDPIPVSATVVPAAFDVVQTVFNENSVANISDSTWLELATIAATTAKLQMSYTAGQPLEFGVGADSGSAARKFVANQGEGPLALDIVIPSGQKLFVRSLGTSVSTGYITINLMAVL